MFAGEGFGNARKALKVVLPQIWQLGDWFLYTTTKIFHLAQGFNEVMAQSSRAASKVQKKGRNAPIGGPFPPSFTMSARGSTPSASSEVVGASIPSYNPVVEKQQAQEKEYPLWKYVTRNQGPQLKLVGGGTVV